MPDFIYIYKHGARYTVTTIFPSGMGDIAQFGALANARRAARKRAAILDCDIVENIPAFESSSVKLIVALVAGVAIIALAGVASNAF